MVDPAVTPQTVWLTSLSKANAYNEWILEEIMPFLGADILEVGCGNGNLTVLLAQHARRLVSVDIDAHLVEFARSRTAHLANVSVRRADATQLVVEQQFDSVILLDVLEHIEDDGIVLAMLRQGLRPGGRIVIKVPAIPFLYNRLDRAVGHYRRYGRSQLRRVMGAAGFCETRVWAFNMLGIAGWCINGSVLRRELPPAEHVDHFNRLVPAVRVLERWVRPPIGLSLFGVGEAPPFN
jgi:SAM-dependent methyltransferase